MDRVSSFLSLRGRKVPRHKSEPLSPAYRPVSSTASSASCSNNLITPATNLLSTNFSTTANTISQARIADSSLALTHTLISEPIYTSSSSSSTPHSSTSTTGIETWAQNLTTPNLHPSPRTFNFSASNPFNQSPPINLKLPSFWEDDIELWLAAVDHQFLLSNISTEQKRFSAILSALDYQVIRKVQNIIRNPGNQPYQTLKQALIKLYKISDDNRLDRLLHQTELGDRKPTELLSELHSLLGESCNVGPDLDKLLRKLFLDRLPPQVRLILAGSPQPTLDLMAQRADDIMATMATTPSLNSNPTQLLQNQIFERRLDQLTDAIDASITFHKKNNSSSAPRDPQFSRSSHFHQSRPNDSSGPKFRPSREMPSTSRQNHRFSPRPTLRTTSKNLCFFHARFGDQARNCRAPCSWQPRPPRNPIDPNHYRLASHACTSQQKAPTTHRLQPLFHDPCSKMHFLLDTGAYISLIPPCKFYKPYYGPQDLIAANGTRIRIFGTKQLNIDVGARYTLRWTFTVADVTLPIIGTDFMRHFGLGVDVANNAFVLPQKSIHSQHQAPRTQSHPIPCISGPNADDTFDSPSTSPRWPDIPHKFPRERHTAFESSNADAANVVSHFVHNLPKIAVDPPLVTDGDVSSILQEPTDPPIQRTLQPPSLSSAQPFDLLKADFLKHKVLARHENNFANTLQPKTITPDVLHTIITTGPPVKTRVRRLSPEQLCFVKREIGALLDAGVLTPSSSPFASAIHIVPKKQPGQFRMVGDYRALNNITQPDRYPLPLISDAIDSLKGCIIFSKFDCLKGYHQIPVHPADRHKTAIITPIGLFEYTTMPFGLRNSGNTFQRFIDDVIYGLDFCFAYVDDILVASKSLEEHEIHLNILMNRFKTFGLTLHKDKCQIAVPEVQFLGHVINQHGVLSSLLRRPVAAITIGDVLREIVCRPINATLLHSLQFGQHFSSRPLVHYVNSQGNLTLGQIYPDGNAYPGVRFIETYIPGRVFTFNIANHFYTFQNYCLTHSRSKVYRLSPTLAPVDVHFDPPNYEEISSLFPTSDFGFEDITSILRTINDANLIHERLTSFLLDRPTAETSANPNYLLDTASSALKSIFMQLISSITNPILNGIVSFLFLLSLFWAAVLSVIALRSFIPGALLATRNRLAKTPNSEATTPV